MADSLHTVRGGRRWRRASDVRGMHTRGSSGRGRPSRECVSRRAAGISGRATRVTERRAGGGGAGLVRRSRRSRGDVASSTRPGKGGAGAGGLRLTIGRGPPPLFLLLRSLERPQRTHDQKRIPEVLKREPYLERPLRSRGESRHPFSREHPADVRVVQAELLGEAADRQPSGERGRVGRVGGVRCLRCHRGSILQVGAGGQGTQSIVGREVKKVLALQ